jgi:integrase
LRQGIYVLRGDKTGDKCIIYTPLTAGAHDSIVVYHAEVLEDLIKKSLSPKKGQRLLFDTHKDAAKGFGLRITQAGGKAFIIKYSFDGRQRRKTIGGWPEWSVVAAREEAARLRRLIDTGVDPLDEERLRREAPTFSDVMPVYLEEKVSGLKSAEQIERYFCQDFLPRHKYTKVQDIRRRDLIDAVKAKAAKYPSAAKNMLAMLKTFMHWCVNQEYLEVNPAQSIKPSDIVVPGKRNALKSVPRERVLSPSEIRSFWESVENCGMSRVTALALKLVLVTGQRPGEVAGMMESEIISGGIWKIPKERRGKTETAHRVPLTPLASDLVEQAREEVLRLSKRRSFKPSGATFEARNGPVTAAALPHAVRKFVDELGNLKDAEWGRWTPHDLRRTCRTGLAAAGVSDEVAEMVIGHEKAGIVKTYNHHSYDKEKRAALSAWVRRLRSILKNESEDQTVVSISGLRSSHS